MLCCGALASVTTLLAQTGGPPTQPLPFSHKAHAGDLKLACKMCHRSPDPGEMMGTVAPGVCMQCHSAIRTESPAIQKLAAAARQNREIDWTRVYSIPAFVAFSHRIHLEGGSTCQDCHGNIAARDVLYRERDISMRGCMDCHRAKKISNNCRFCHDAR